VTKGLCLASLDERERGVVLTEHGRELRNRISAIEQTGVGTRSAAASTARELTTTRASTTL
jgi:hypothetical protein